MLCRRLVAWDSGIERRSSTGELSLSCTFPGRVKQGSSFFFDCVGFSYVVLDLVCSVILPSDWLAEPCPNDTYVEELVSTKTSCFRTR